jgi:hypothetical protein
MDEIQFCGHRYSLRKMDPADMLDLIEAAGENANNRAWLHFAMIVCSVQAIDGIPVPFPRDAAGIKDLARRLGTDGVEALRAKLLNEPAENAIDTAKN